MTRPKLYIEPEGDSCSPRGARPNAPERCWVPVRPLVDEVLESLSGRLKEQGVRVEVDIDAGHGVLADRDMLRRCVLNLAVNALDAMPKGGELVVTSCVGGRGFELEVADSGPGLTEEVRRRAFEPYFSTKSNRTGLGLSIVAHFAQAHGGNVEVRNCPEGGAAFTIRIPQQALEAAA